MLKIKLFGELEIEYEAEHWPFRGLPKTRPLLAWLLLNRQQPVARHTVAMALWPDQPESKIRSRLRRSLYDLLNKLPPAPEDCPWIIANRREIQWNPEVAVWIDVEAFQDGLLSAETRLPALSHYHDDLLPNLYEDWLIPFREQLRSQFFEAHEALLTIALTVGDRKTALHHANSILIRDPIREHTVRLLMQVHQASGDRASAIASYQQFCEQLREELDVEPLAETQLLYEGIAKGKAMATSTAGSATPAPTNLRAYPNRFFGRTPQLTDLIGELLEPNGARLFSLTGTGGTGKTRLATEVALRLHSYGHAAFHDGIIFIDLALVDNGELLLDTIAHTIDSVLVSETVTVNNLHKLLQTKKLLLIFDNFEQIVTSGSVVADLLAHCPQVRAIVTSRSPLRCYGEHELPLPALQTATSTASLHTLSETASIALFVERARAAKSSFELTDDNAATIVKICSLVDGLPLAIEIAAAGLRHRSPAMLGQQLEETTLALRNRSQDVPSRHATLNAAIEWSYRLLSPEQQQLLCSVSLFPSSFDVAAADRLFAAMEGTGSCYDLLTDLVDNSLLQIDVSAETPRFRLLITVREFAQQALAQSTMAHLALSKAFVKHFFALVDDQKTQFRTPGASLAFQILDQESDNLRHALQLGLASTDNALVQASAEVLIYLEPWCDARTRWVEHSMLYRAALARKALLTHEIVILLLIEEATAQSRLVITQDAQTRIIAPLLQAVSLARDPQIPSILLGNALSKLGIAYTMISDFGKAEPCLLEAVELMRGVDDPDRTMAAIGNLAIAYKDAGNFGSAAEYLEHAIEIIESGTIERQPNIAGTYMTYCTCLTFLGEYELALAALRKSIEIAIEYDHQRGQILAISAFAELLFFMQQWRSSTIFHAALQRMCADIGWTWPQRYQDEFANYMEKLEQMLGEEAFAEAVAFGRNVTLREAITLAQRDIEHMTLPESTCCVGNSNNGE